MSDTLSRGFATEDAEILVLLQECAAGLFSAWIKRIDVKLCTAELRPVLPDKVFSSLAEQKFKALRSSLESVFMDWI